MKSLTLKLILLSLIAGTAFAPKPTYGMNKQKNVIPKTKKQLNQKLLSAATSIDIETVKNCLDYGANINTKGQYGRTPLMLACIYEHFNIVQYLVENGAQLNNQDKDGYTPLTIACDWGKTDIVQCLVENGANLNTQDNDGYTPLMLACYSGYTNIVEYLVENGAHLYTQDNNDRTAYNIAVQKGFLSIAEYLAVIQNEPKNFKINPLHLTTFAPESAFIKMLYKERIYYIDTSKYTVLCSIFAKFQKSNNHNELKKILDGCKFLQCSKAEMKKLNTIGFPLNGQELSMQENFIKNIQESNSFDLNIIYHPNSNDVF